MNLPRKCIAIKALLLLALLLAEAAAYAITAGTVTHLSGALLARKADGTVKILSQNSVVEQGDTLVSEKDTYARIKFIDNGEMTLRPNTQIKIDRFAYDEAKPENDSALFNLIKGGLRAITGLVAKRNQDRFGLNTPTATIGIRGTIFIAEYLPPPEASVAAFGFASSAAVAPSLLPTDMRVDAPDPLPTVIVPLRIAQSSLPGAAARAPGLYVQVLDGIINLSNSAGSQNFVAGQFGYTASIKLPPIVLPANPGMQFAPPPSFPTSTGTPGAPSSSTKKAAVDCEVR